MLHSWLASVGWGELDFDGAWLVDKVILAAVLVSESVSSDDDWLDPAWYATRNIIDDDGLSEDGTVENVSDGAVWTLPHLLQVKLLDSALVWGDGSALDSNLMLLGSLGAVDRNLIVSCVTRSHRQVIVLCLEVDIRVDVSLLDPLPDDTSHLITINIDDWLSDLDLAESSAEVSLLLGNSGEHLKVLSLEIIIDKRKRSRYLY